MTRSALRPVVGVLAVLMLTSSSCGPQPVRTPGVGLVEVYSQTLSECLERSGIDPNAIATSDNQGQPSSASAEDLASCIDLAAEAVSAADRTTGDSR
jgi:hypothetical protein